MVRKSSAGFTISVQNQISLPLCAANCILRAVGGLLLFAAAAGVLCVGFALPADAKALAAGAFSVVCTAVFAQRRDRLALLPLAVVLAAVVFCLVFSHTVENSLLCLANRFLQWRQAHSATVFPLYACEETPTVWAAAPLCAAGGAALGALAALLPAGGIAVFFLLLPLVLWSGAGGGWLLAALCGSAVLLLAGKDGRQASRTGLSAGALLLLGAGAVAGATVMLTIGTTVRTDGAADALHRSVHTLRYESAQQALPEGDLRQLKGRSSSKEPMLQVTISQPVSQYLRGYVGQRYTASGWRAADAADMLAEYQAFYRFHQEGWDSFSQLSSLAELLGTDASTVQVDISVLGACRSTVFIPYGLRSGSSVVAAEQLRDTVPISNGTTGEKEYSFTARGDLVGKAYTLLSELNDHWQEDDFREYITFEGYYRDFVYNNYVTIPEATQEMLAGFLGDAPDTLTSYEAKRRILNCLDEMVTYSETPGSIDDGVDFVTGFLQDTATGYDVHYATAATVMLRYFGIPARYVEGYLITPAAIEGASGKTTLTLTGQDAHAWAEYYEDGVGWIPFETTPGYRGVMEEPQWLWFEEDENADLTGSSNGEGGDGDAQTNRRTDIQEDELPENGETTLQVITDAIYDYFSRLHLGPIWWLYVLLWLLAAAMTVLLVRRVVICRRRHALFEQEDDRAATEALCAYVLALAWHSGAPWKNVPLSQLRDVLCDWGGDALDADALLELNDRAHYSAGLITQEQRDSAALLVDTALELLKEKCTVGQRLRLKWLRCLY